MKLSPSILAAQPEADDSFSQAIELAQKGGASYIHIDVMDGVFVQAQTMWNNPQTITNIQTNLPLDIHLMIHNPDERIEEFLACKPHILSFHFEASLKPRKTLRRIQQAGVRAGLAISPQTAIKDIAGLLELVDHLIIMTIHPGAAGRAFMPELLDKVRQAKKLRAKLHIEIDGGINEHTALLAQQAGADIIVSSSYIYKSKNPLENIKKLLHN